MSDYAMNCAWMLLKGNPAQLTPYRAINRLAHQQDRKRQLTANEKMSDLSEEDKEHIHLPDSQLASPRDMAEFAQKKPLSAKSIAEDAEKWGRSAETADMNVMDDDLYTISQRKDAKRKNREHEDRSDNYHRTGSLRNEARQNAFRMPQAENPHDNKLSDDQKENLNYLDFKGYKFDHPQDIYAGFDDGYGVDNYHSGPFASDDEY